MFIYLLSEFVRLHIYILIFYPEGMIEWIEQYKHKQRQMRAEQAGQAKVDTENSLQTSDQLIEKIMDAQPRWDLLLLALHVLTCLSNHG